MQDDVHGAFDDYLAALTLEPGSAGAAYHRKGCAGSEVSVCFRDSI